MVIRITSPRFVAGIVVGRELVVHAAPILCYMVGWHVDKAINYALKRGWLVG